MFISASIVSVVDDNIFFCGRLSFPGFRVRSPIIFFNEAECAKSKSPAGANVRRFHYVYSFSFTGGALLHFVGVTVLIVEISTEHTDFRYFRLSLWKERTINWIEYSPRVTQLHERGCYAVIASLEPTRHTAK